MRYLGNKTKLLSEIDDIINKKNLNKRGLIFFDAFSGTGTVAHHYKERYKLISNDYLYFCSVIAEAKLNYLIIG